MFSQRWPSNPMVGDNEEENRLAFYILGVGLDIKDCVAILSNQCSQIRIESEMNEKSLSRKSKS